MHVQFAFSCKLKRFNYGHDQTDLFVTPALTVVVPRECTPFPFTSRLSREYHRRPAACALLLACCQSVWFVLNLFSRGFTNLVYFSHRKFHRVRFIGKGRILSAIPLGWWHLDDDWLWSILHFRSQFVGWLLDWLPNRCGCWDRHGHAASDYSCTETLD